MATTSENEQLKSSGIGQLKVHYYLRGGVHQIDALTRNKAEAEMLALLQDVAATLGVELKLQTRAYGKGGLLEFWELLGKSEKQITVIVAIIKLLFFLDNYLDHRTQEKQQIELHALNIKKLQLEIKKMEEEANEEKSKNPSSRNFDLDLEERPADLDFARALLSLKKITLRRSNFYQHLIDEPTLEAVGFASSHTSKQERIVKRKKFTNYIAECRTLDPWDCLNIQIELISPVLRPRAIRWRGIFENRIISFELEDAQFRNDVYAKKVQFTNGTTLTCDLRVFRIENEIGEAVIHNYVVTKVHQVIEPIVLDLNPQSQAQGELGLDQ